MSRPRQPAFPGAFRARLSRGRLFFGARLLSRLANLFVVFLVDVDIPEVVRLSQSQVASGVKPGEHGMILVIVTVQSVAADGLNVIHSGDEILNGREAIPVVGVVDRIRLRHPEDATVLNDFRLDQADMLELAFAEFDQFGVAGAPEPVSLVAEVFEAKAAPGLVRNHRRTPVLEILDPTDLDVGLVDVNPVVVEQVGFVDDQEADGEEVSILELSGGFANLLRGRGIELLISSVTGMLEMTWSAGMSSDLPSCSINTPDDSRAVSLAPIPVMLRQPSRTAPPHESTAWRNASHIIPGPSSG